MGEGDLSPEQQAELDEWMKRAKEQPKTVSHETKKIWGFRTTNLKDQGKLDEEEHPSKK